MRWAMRFRRYRVQASTLASNLRVLGKIYDWAWQVAELDLDDYLTSGHMLSGGQLESLVAYLRESAVTRDGQSIAPNTYNSYLSTTESFLTWSLYPANRGGVTLLGLEELNGERERLKLFFSPLRVSSNQTQRLQPLTDEEIAQIRSAIAPYQNDVKEWMFPAGAFSPQTALRNWLMFEVAYELGLRRGELLKLRLDSLPRGAEESILVRRFPDDPHDRRAREPAVKTAERKVPASRALLRAIRVYLTTPPPTGRAHGHSPYLFVTRDGNPLSIDTAQDIIRAIGRHSDVQPLSWHRLRHTWAERVADLLLDQPNGIDVLMYLGGWSHPASAKRYFQNALSRQATDLLRQYQANLYASEEEVKS
jgi:integrase